MSQKTSIISPPPNTSFLQLKKHYIMLCDGDTCMAALLAVFEGWSNQESVKENDGWFFRNYNQLAAEDLLGLYGRSSIIKAIDRLIAWDYVERRNNPKRKNDRTYQYRLRVDVLQWLINLFQFDSLELNVDGLKLNDGEFKSKPTIQQTTTDQDKNTSGDDAPGEPAKTKRARPRDEIYELVCLGSFGKSHDKLPKAQRGRVNKITKEIKALDITPAQLEAGYKLYFEKNPDIKSDPTKRLKSPDAIADWCAQAADLATPLPDVDPAAMDWYHHAYRLLHPSEPLNTLLRRERDVIELELIRSSQAFRDNLDTLMKAYPDEMSSLLAKFDQRGGSTNHG